MDVSLLEPGSVDFNLLNDTCLILIAPFDIFGRGLYRYTFEGVCRECPDLKLEDGATISLMRMQKKHPVKESSICIKRYRKSGCLKKEE